MDGVLVVDKPAGPTSHDIVDRARRAFSQRRAGHTGTLDPFATGVLAVCLGRATRLARFLSAGDKVYRASVRLGFATTTDDLTGDPIGPAQRASVDEATVRRALLGLLGTFDQVPPSFSARRTAGRRLYELARRGEQVPRAATRVTVHAIDLLALDEDRIEIEVRCSPGTYVRALARDLGAELGVGGHLTALRRTRSGPFDLARAVPGDALSPDVREAVLPLRALLTDLPAVRVGEEGRRLVQRGRDLSRGAVVSGFPGPGTERVRVLDESGDLVALAVQRGFSLPPPGPALEAVLHPDLVLLDGR